LARKFLAQEKYISELHDDLMGARESAAQGLNQ
jgi:hypothetical protein